MSTSAFSKALMYFLMLLSLFFMGAGRFFSVDWFLHRGMHKKIEAKNNGVNNHVNEHRHDHVDDQFDLDNTTDH